MSERGCQFFSVPSYLRHHPVCTGVFLVLEDDVRVVVRRELLETLRVARYFPLVPAARSERLLSHVGAELFVGERG